MADQEQGNIKQDYNSAQAGMNMDLIPSQIPKGCVSYAINAAVENYDDNGIVYQNEPGNELCISLPEGFMLIGKHFIPEQNKHIFFITNPISGESQIGYMENNDCLYHILVDAICLNFSIHHPIHKVIHKLTNCSTEIYWTDGYNPRRYLDIDNIPKIIRSGSPLCSPVYTSDIDCNQLKVQANFDIPLLQVDDVVNGGNLISGTYQFAIQYSDALSNPFSSFYSVTNPLPIADDTIISVNFDYKVGKSIIISVSNLDITGLYEYFNLAVIKTVNGITSSELVGTYFIDKDTKTITYTGQNVTSEKFSLNDIFEKYPYYEIADDITAAQDILIWKGLTSIDKVNYQKIANDISLQWETWRIPPGESYKDEWNAANLLGYPRDEIVPFEIVFLLDNGKQTEGFHIPGREKNLNENQYADIADTNDDFVGTPSYYSGGVGYSPYWRIYNTANVIGFSPQYSNAVDYKGPYQYGEFAYWESTEEYPCNENVWGELAGKKIRHHKFPDVAISPIFETKVFVDKEQMEMGDTAIYPIGIKVEPQQIQSLIELSDLSREDKDSIVGFKIVRGNRSTNKSIVAKGILRNVNVYEREEKEYYFPNYPYNDLGDDPFINGSNNAYRDSCDTFDINITELFYDPNRGYDCAIVSYVDCNTNKTGTTVYTTLGVQEQQCSIGKPVISFGKGTVSYVNYDLYSIAWAPETGNMGCGGFRVEYNDITEGVKQEWVAQLSSIFDVQVVVGTVPQCVEYCDRGLLCGKVYQITYKGTFITDSPCVSPEPLPGTTDKYRQVFNSPETSFGQPFLGDILKVESVIYGKGEAHFVKVKDNAKYRLISKEAQELALDSAAKLGGITDPFDVSAMFASYQAYLEIYLRNITRKNYAYSFNSRADYNYTNAVPDNQEIKQRNLDIARYLIPSVLSTGDDKDINNWQRESSVYLKTDETKDPLPFPSESPNMLSGINSIVTDNSRFTISEVGNCNTPEKKEDIQVVSYYGSIKNDIVNLWGQIYSYETIDTGFTYIFGVSQNTTVFGGDTFISRFAFKTKLPFFIDNRVGAPDDSDVFYDEIGNVGYPKYWHSSRSIFSNYEVPPGESDTSPGTLVNFISYKAHNFDCPNDTSISTSSGVTSTTTTTSTTVPPTTTTTTTTVKSTVGKVTDGDSEITYYDGYFYLFAYGVPYFYCETSYNADLRQAFNNKEGDFWPHVSTSIPDDWVQEVNVSIANDNTYYYNSSYSKQNKENYFSHLPFDWDNTTRGCYSEYPFRAIYSDPQSVDADNRINSWRIYRAVSYFDFPQNFGSLTSLDGIQNRAILARFENKSLLYGNLLTLDTSNPQLAYMGNPNLFNKQTPPVDFAETDLGYAGSQHKFLLKIPQGQITVDAKRGQVFLISGTEVADISGFGSGMNRFLTDHLSFEIQRYFPEVDIDNHFNGIGLHGVYDAKYDRAIITKLDYVPLDENITYEDYEFYYTDSNGIKSIISLNNPTYFCNKSWTLSYNLNTRSWISFHSYLPNWYIGENNFYYSGLNDCCDDFEFIAAELPSNFDCRIGGHSALEGCEYSQCWIEGQMCCSTPITTTSTTTIPPITTTTSTTSGGTTTSTTTVQGETTTTTSTTEYPCKLEGEAIALCLCEMIGVAIEECSTTTTTTTECIRPEGLSTFYFITGYTLEGYTVDSTESEWTACSMISFLSDNPTITPDFIGGQANEISEAEHVYLLNGSSDCECMPDGWYFTDETSSYGYVFHVVDCEIVEIYYCDTTTTTTTSIPTTTSTTTLCELVATLNAVVCENITTTTTTTLTPPTTTTTTTIPPTTTTTTTQTLAECLEGLTVEMIYIHSNTDLNLLPAGYDFPKADKWNYIGVHTCNVGLFELSGNSVYICDSRMNNLNGGNDGGQTANSHNYICRDYDNVPDALSQAKLSQNWIAAGGNSLSRYDKATITHQQALDIIAAGGVWPYIEFSLNGAIDIYGGGCYGITESHEDVTWIRMTNSSGQVVYNDIPGGGKFFQIDVCEPFTTTTTTTGIPPTTTTSTTSIATIKTLFVNYSSL